MPLTRTALAPALFAAAAAAAAVIGWQDWQRLRAVPAWQTPPAQAAATQSGDSPAPAASRQGLADLAVFGRPDAVEPQAPAAPPSTVNEADLPPPQADYQLFGIIEATEQGRARAIIGAADGSQREYRVGDDMPDGARIHAVRERAVIFDRGGQLERLALPSLDDNAGAGTPVTPGQLPGGGPGRRPPARFAQPAPPPMPEIPMPPTEVPPPVEEPPVQYAAPQ